MGLHGHARTDQDLIVPVCSRQSKPSCRDVCGRVLLSHLVMARCRRLQTLMFDVDGYSWLMFGALDDDPAAAIAIALEEKEEEELIN